MRITKYQIINNINKINEMIDLGKNNSTIDIEDLKAERKNAYKILKKMRKSGKNQIEIGG